MCHLCFRSQSLKFIGISCLFYVKCETNESAQTCSKKYSRMAVRNIAVGVNVETDSEGLVFLLHWAVEILQKNRKSIKYCEVWEME
jgi:hypothetical protein